MAIALSSISSKVIAHPPQLWRLGSGSATSISVGLIRKAHCEYPYSVTLFSPLSHAVFGATDRPRDCAVVPRPQARGSPQAYTYAGVAPLPATSAVALS